MSKSYKDTKHLTNHIQNVGLIIFLNRLLFAMSDWSIIQKVYVSNPFKQNTNSWKANGARPIWNLMDNRFITLLFLFNIFFFAYAKVLMCASNPRMTRYTFNTSSEHLGLLWYMETFLIRRHLLECWIWYMLTFLRYINSLFLKDIGVFTSRLFIKISIWHYPSYALTQSVNIPNLIMCIGTLFIKLVCENHE